MTRFCSSSTTVPGPTETSGPSPLMLPASCRPVPWKPVSEDPTESVKNAFGKVVIQRSLIGRLKMAALEAMAAREDPSYPPSS